MNQPSSIPFSSITVSDRARKDYGDISGLRASLATIGSIHPIVLSRNPDNTYALIAGGRRHKAMTALGVTELHYASILNPAKLGYVFEEDVSEELRKEAELDENLYRLQTKWQEDCILVDDIHRLKRKVEGHKWGQRQTAAMLGPGYGKSNVNNAINLAPFIRAGDPEILACKTMMEALSVRIKRKEDEALAELTKRATNRVVLKPTGVGFSHVDTSSFLDTLSVSTTKEVMPHEPGNPQERSNTSGLQVTSPPPSNPLAVSTPTVSAPRPVVPLSSMFQCADTITALWPMVDHIVTDIPYGIDMDNLEGVEDVRDTHDVHQNVDMMRPFLTKAFASVKPGGFCVFFYDLQHHEKLRDWATEIGWKVQRWPFIAVKSSPCRNGAAQYNTTKNYEVAMLLRRDEKTVLRKVISTSWREYNFAAERALYNNPFAKPFALWKDIYDMIAFPGQSVLDPFCGEMSACRAAANCGLTPYGIELSEQHYNRGLQHMRAVYALIHKSNVDFI